MKSTSASREAPSTNRRSAARDLLKHWHSRGVIDDDRLVAGRRFQSLFERAAGGCHSSTAFDRVQRSGHNQIPSEVSARSELAALKPVLGETDFGLLVSVLGQGRNLDTEVQDASEYGKAYVARRIRDALDVISTRIG
ncbi:hypothetical protein LGH83_04485 [Lichenihabitans sp. PAMC28606]|uniref:hypothetical protein n=1 Tax=Lichenihabitans sp. PAMC28606 TaxID=2880932 RepID=UPI001D0A2D42|nr:hypothetical protein [Lichenihabitans sp. PAMC28606]UDL95484.1 hypothetical protein LGH83_04485 [Lichenihabitans sp. PAMC28606]